MTKPRGIPGSDERPPLIRFGTYELDARAGELRKHGIRIRLRQQTLEILFMLLENPGEVVLRSEIQARLWPEGTIVEFDHSINAAIQKLRDALCETADNPRHIETLKGRGYRFIGQVELVEKKPPIAQQPPHVSLPAIPAQVPDTSHPPMWWRSHWFAGVLVFVIFLAMAGFTWNSRHSPQKLVLSLGQVEFPVISPDGSTVVYRNTAGMVLRRMDSLSEVQLYGGPLRVIDAPAWSPDSSSVVFATMYGIYRMKVPSGPPVRIGDTVGPTRGLSWGADDTILVADIRHEIGGLSLLGANGGPAKTLQLEGFSSGIFYQPQFLPNGKDFLFAWSAIGEEEAGLYVSRIQGGQLVGRPRLLRKNVTGGQFLPVDGGALLFVQNSVLYRQTLNTRDGALEGDPHRIVDGVFTRTSLRRACFSVSRTGVLAWTKGREALTQVTLFDRTGRVLGTVGPATDGESIRLSPDEQYVIIGTTRYRTAALDTKMPKADATVLPDVLDARWLGDSARVVYHTAGARSSLLWRPINYGSPAELARIPELTKLQDISADGKMLLFGDRAWSLYAMPVGEQAHPPYQSLTGTGLTVVSARFSPDGKWIVYAAGSGGSFHLYLQRPDPGALRREVSLGPGNRPVWRRDGKEIIYFSLGKLYSLRVQIKGDNIETSAPQALFAVRESPLFFGSSTPIDVTRNGSRILYLQAQEDTEYVSYVMTGLDNTFGQ